MAQGRQAQDAAVAPAAQPMAMAAAFQSATRSYAALAKTGARSSEADQTRIQAVHDVAVDLGAACGAQKIAPRGLEKRFDALAATLADVLQRVKHIEAQPLPLPFAGPARAIGKSEDAGFASGDGAAIDRLLLDPDALSVLAIKLAQRNGRAPLR